jgi:hypothetical protein
MRRGKYLGESSSQKNYQVQLFHDLWPYYIGFTREAWARRMLGRNWPQENALILIGKFSFILQVTYGIEDNFIRRRILDLSPSGFPCPR